MKPINLFDYETLAKEQMELSRWEYFQGGSDDEVTLRANRLSYEYLCLHPRILVDVSKVDTHTTVQGIPVSMPILVAPMAFHCLAHPQGECATAEAASRAGTIMIASTFATRSLEEIAHVAQSPLWFQLYLYRSLDSTKSLIHRAEEAGYQALVLTVDTPRLGRRERDIRNAFTLPPDLRLANFASDALDGNALPEPAVATWETIQWLRSITTLPILLKGIVTGQDALLALEYAVNGIIVSNHGGRQLDGMVTSIEALPEVLQAVAGRCEVYMDGGIRRGTDVLKALALGARAVFIGRPILWGLTVDGAAGAFHILELLQAELNLAMTLAGCPTPEHINRSLVKFRQH